MQASLLGSMSSDLLIPRDKLDFLIRSSPYRYKVYPIKKKSGSGYRTIAQPAKEVKSLQYWAIDNLFSSFPIHSSCSAYVKGKNIFDNAKIHASNPYLLKLDFKDFFPSITGNDFVKFCSDHNNFKFSDQDIYRLMRILFWLPERNYEFKLSIGAPSSPFLSNSILYHFDLKLSEYCTSKGISYSRYADDMTFSMENSNNRGETLIAVKDLLKIIKYPKLCLNENKTIFGSKSNKRLVTGLILSNDGKVSLGRKRKRMISAKIHCFKNNKLTDTEKANLQGIVSFALNIEPDFIQRMKKKYGKRILDKIIHTNLNFSK